MTQIAFQLIALFMVILSAYCLGVAVERERQLRRQNIAELERRRAMLDRDAQQMRESTLYSMRDRFDNQSG